jgi:hypothetical protein
MTTKISPFVLALVSFPWLAACAVETGPLPADGQDPSKAAAVADPSSAVARGGKVSVADLTSHPPCMWTLSGCGEFGDGSGGQSGGDTGGGGGDGTGPSNENCQTNCLVQMSQCQIACLQNYGNNVVLISGHFYPAPPSDPGNPGLSYSNCFTNTCSGDDAACDLACYLPPAQ